MPYLITSDAAPTADRLPNLIPFLLDHPGLALLLIDTTLELRHHFGGITALPTVAIRNNREILLITVFTPYDGAELTLRHRRFCRAWWLAARRKRGGGLVKLRLRPYGVS